MPELSDRQDRQWSRQAAKYDDLFLDPFRPGVVNPLLDAIRSIPDPASKAVADLGCGTGPLVPLLAERFAEVVALDFAPKMVEVAKKRLKAEDHPERVKFLVRPMHELDDLEGRLDVAIAVNSIVMPDVRQIDNQCLKALPPRNVPHCIVDHPYPAGRPVARQPADDDATVFTHLDPRIEAARLPVDRLRVGFSVDKHGESS